MLCNPAGNTGVRSRASLYRGEGAVLKHMLACADDREASRADVGQGALGWGRGKAEQHWAFSMIDATERLPAQCPDTSSLTEDQRERKDALFS